MNSVKVPEALRWPKNPAEFDFVAWALQEGWHLMRRGYPDYACFTDKGELIFVEVKRKRSHRLKKEQLFLMQKIAERGIRCFRWTPDGGFQQVMAPQETV